MNDFEEVSKNNSDIVENNDTIPYINTKEPVVNNQAPIYNTNNTPNIGIPSVNTNHDKFINMDDFDIKYADKLKSKYQRTNKKRNHTTAKIVAILLAVGIIGGGASFGGTYIANKLNHNIVVDTSKDPIETDKNKPTLDDIISNNPSNNQHTVNENAEFNSDGTYKYTRDLVKTVQDSIVYIEIYGKNYWSGAEQLTGSASGIIISSDGYIVTNHHVVQGGTSFKVKVYTTNNKERTSETYEATVLGADEDTDLAVLKIDATNLSAAVLGDSDTLQQGDDVVAIGNPLGLESSVSKGIVSGLNRHTSQNARSLTSIQTDAAINSGNSGGALFNGYGEVIGVVNEKMVSNYAESLGFAITINDAKTVINDLISKGYVSGRAILGINYINVNEYMAMFRGIPAGWQVAEIDPEMPVAQSGLVVGDTIVEIDGKSVLDGSASNIFASKNPGDTVIVTVVRSNNFGRDKNIDIEVILGEDTGK